MLAGNKYHNLKKGSVTAFVMLAGVALMAGLYFKKYPISPSVLFSGESFGRAIFHIDRTITTKFFNACENPLKYTLGTIDPRYNLSDDEILQMLRKTEAIWEDEVGNDLFVYVPDTDRAVVVNFIFDERQLGVIAAQNSEEQITTDKNNYQSLLGEYEAIQADYERDAEVYEGDLARYDRIRINFDNAVARWNQNPGSNSEYAELQDQRATLENLQAAIEGNRIILNQTVTEMNQLAEEVNEYQEIVNQQVNFHNDRFADGERFNAGDYGSYEINIYQYESELETILTLAHEFGHAIGIDHVADENSIMHYLLADQAEGGIELGVGDKVAIDNLCGS